VRKARSPGVGFARSFATALRGLVLFFQFQRNARIQAAAGILACLAAWILGLATWQKVVVVLCIGAVLAAEAFNSAIERLADRVTAEPDPLIRDAKDLAAGAVLLAAVTAAVVGVVVFFPSLAKLFANGFAGN